MNLPPEIASQPILHGTLTLGAGLTLATLCIHNACQIAGRVYTALRAEGGLRGVWRSVYLGSATAGGETKQP